MYEMICNIILPAALVVQWEVFLATALSVAVINIDQARPRSEETVIMEDVFS